MPTDMISSPDGSCAFAVERHSGQVVVQAYHWANFGSSSGICLEFPDLMPDDWVVTSFAKRTSTRCHFVTLHAESQSIQSAVLEITHKSTEFTFQADGHRKTTHHAPAAMTHASLIECHREVWTRFPVMPAVRRHTFLSSTRQPRSLAFISQIPTELFHRHYHQMVHKFENTARKPTGGELSSVEICGRTYDELLDEGLHNVSRFNAGEWLVDIICLIPIHLAVARDNRFVPLKNGVWSPDLERSLLGATVDQVIDRLSFGWYESIFQSYMSAKVTFLISSSICAEPDIPCR